MADLPAGLRVLIIEDDEPVRRILARIMKLGTAEVTTADDGMAGLRALETGTFDVVITDLKMPGIGGLDLAGWVRRRRPSLPVIVTSGFATVDDTGRIAELGALLLRKPFTPDVVYAIVREALAKVRVPTDDG